jgi:glycogen synthase
MTRILVLSNMYPPHHLGGYELSCRDVMDRLRARGHEVAVLTTTMRVPGVTEPQTERRDGIHRELAFYWRDHLLLRPWIPRRLAIERANQRALARALGEFRPDVVSAWNMGAMSLGLLTSIVERDMPLVLNVCDEWPWYGPHVDPWTKLFLGRPALARAVRPLAKVPTALADLGDAATFCFVSEAMRTSVERKTPWRPRVSTIVYSGIDRSDFPHTAASERPWRWKILVVGRLDERKGVHIAIEALRGLPVEATLEVLGRGDAVYERRLKTLAEELGVAGRVRFATVAREQLRERYLDADVVVFPTLWDEPFGLVPVEALACRTPVVATATGGSAEFLADGLNILRVPVGDPGAIAGAIQKLAADSALRSRLTDAGQRTAEDLTIERLTDALEPWHVATAERFANGMPAHRPAPVLDP